MRVSSVILVAISYCTLISCKPNISDCAECLTYKYDGAIRVTNRTKKNGVESEKGGYKVYDIYFSCNIIFTKNYDVKLPGKGIFESFNKGDEFEIENAHAQFIKTDNRWLCNGADYDVLNGFYSIQPNGTKISADEYFRKKAETKQSEPICYVGTIDNYIHRAALNIRVNKFQLTAKLYNQETKQISIYQGYISNENKWVITINNTTWLEGDNSGGFGRYEGVLMQNGSELGNFSFRQLTFDWEKTKQFEEIGVKSDLKATTYKPVAYYAAKSKVFFYSEPDSNSQRPAYLIAGEKISAIKRIGNYVYAEFVNKKGTTTNGWLDINDLELVNP